jgi:hypothetical protein
VTALDVKRAPAAALPRIDLRDHQPTGPREVIQRHEDDGVGLLPAASIISELQRIASDAVRLREQAIPRDTRFLRELTIEVEDLVAGCDPAARDQIEPQLAIAQDEIVASFQAVAAFHAERTERSWQGASDDERSEQRAEYQQESGWPYAGQVDQDWCGMFADAQFRAAGLADEFNTAWNHVDSVAGFFSYTGDKSPMTIQPHGEGPEAGTPLRDYHEQRGSLRRWALGTDVGADIRAGDVVTLDWDGDGIADHICIAASYTPPAGDQPGRLVTIDGNVFPAADSTVATSDIAERTYEQTSASGAAPAFSGPRSMQIFGRGRPSAVDFETDHVYPGFTGKLVRDTDGPSGPIQSPGIQSPEIQRVERGPVAAADPAAAFDAAAAGSPGELPYRDEMQARLGTDFSAVRAFTGRDLTALGAHAATRGDQVVFASSSPDRQTVAHELTHVVQSRQGRVGGAAVSDPGDASEHEARGVAAAVTAGAPATVGAAPRAAIQRQDDATAVPDATNPALGSNRQDVALDWSGTDYIIPPDYRLPVSNSTPGSIREIYNFYALHYLCEQLPALVDEYGAVPGEDMHSIPDGRYARQAAVDGLNALIQRRMQQLIVFGDPGAAETIRRGVFAANEHAIADTLIIPGGARYDQIRNGEGEILDTWCNVFAFDVVTAMGGYLPRQWWTTDAIAMLQRGAQPTADMVQQQRANDLYNWMNAWGTAHFGWEALGSPQEAQQEANLGQIVVILGSTGTEAPGHISVVMAETARTHKAPKLTQTKGAYVPLQAQAGAENFATNAAGVSADQVGQTGRRAWWEDDAFHAPDTRKPDDVAALPWWERGEGLAGSGFYVYRADRENRGFGELAIQTPEEVGAILPEEPSSRGQ